MVIAFWTKDEEEKLKKLWEQGLTSAKIASIMGKSRNSIIGKAHAKKFRRNYDGKPPETHRVAKRVKPAPPPKPAPKAVPKPAITIPKFLAPKPIAPTERTQLEPEPLKPTWVPFLEQGPNHCKWIVAGEKETSMVCGDVRVHDRPYCPKHCDKAYAKDIRRPVKNGLRAFYR